jgi:hypothetical protein
MQTKTVTYEHNGLKASVTVSEATTLIGMRRTRMQVEARQQEEIDGQYGTMDQDVRMLRRIIYPDLIAPVTAIDVNGVVTVPSFDEFVELPEAFTAQWEQAVYELNKHWLPEKRDDPKAPTTSISG